MVTVPMIKPNQSLLNQGVLKTKMKSRSCDCRTVVLLLIFMSDLPWMNHDCLVKISGAEASDLTKLSKSYEDSSAARSILHNRNLQMEPIFHMSEKLEDPPPCHNVTAELANASAVLISCFVQNARPVTVCQNCVEEYINFYHVYKNIFIQYPKCEGELLNKDRLNVIKRTCSFVSSLWNEGYCSNCFVKEDDGSLTPNLNNDTKKFLKEHDFVKKCFQNHTQVYNMGANGSAVCSSCLKKYSALYKEYEHLQQQYPDAVCMDLTDIMNTTRVLWSGYYHCKVTAASGLYVCLLATLFCILVVVFYSGYRFIARAQNTRIIGQKRFISWHSHNSSSGLHQLNSLQYDS